MPLSATALFILCLVTYFILFYETAIYECVCVCVCVFYCVQNAANTCIDW